MSLPERFWRKVEKTDTCWLWTGRLHRGYGVMQIDGVQRQAHVWVYREFVGPVPEGHTLHHTCETKRCVNHAHVKPMTFSEHSRLHGKQYDNLGRYQRNKKCCPKGHPYRVGLRGNRYCQTCKTEWMRKRRARKP